MKVEFSKLALTGLARVYPDSEKRESIRLAITFFLRAYDAERKATPLPAFPDKQIYLYPLDRCRIIYELVRDPRSIAVWSIKEIVAR